MQANWLQQVIYLALDTSLFWEKYCERAAVCGASRSRQAAWRARVMAHGSASISLLGLSRNDSIGSFAITSRNQGGVTGRPRCKFILTPRRMLTTQLGWHYRIGPARDSWIWRRGKGWCQLKDFHVLRGEALCFHQVRLQKAANYGLVHVIIGRNNIKVEFWAVVSDEKTCLKTNALVWVTQRL
ncbi:MAG: hypothetical protein F6J99_15350 [Moorea sp. SIO4G3]|nr:hypothetical protein [Moorena sp. SIO4G3]